MFLSFFRSKRSKKCDVKKRLLQALFSLVISGCLYNGILQTLHFSLLLLKVFFLVSWGLDLTSITVHWKPFNENPTLQRQNLLHSHIQKERTLIH